MTWFAEHRLAKSEGDPAIGLQFKIIVAVFDEFGDHLVKVKLRMKGLRLIHESLRELGTRDNRQGWNVIDRFFRVELRALAAGAIEYIDDMALDIQQAKFKNRKQAARPRPNDHRISGNNIRHLKLRLRSELLFGNTHAQAADRVTDLDLAG